MESLRIEWFTDSFAPMLDGTATQLEALGRELAREGHQVTVRTPRNGPGATGVTEEEGVTVKRHRSLPVPGRIPYRWAIFPFGPVLGGGLPGGTDVVHVHTPGVVGSVGLFAARRAELPVLGTFHTDLYAMRGGFEHIPGHRLLFSGIGIWAPGIYFRCDGCTAPTEPAREALLAYARKPWRHEVEIVPSGIDASRFHPGIGIPDWRARCGLSDAPLITFLGRLTIDKGVGRLLDALDRLPADLPWNGVIGGTGPQAPTIQERIRASPRLRERVRYVGPVAEEEKPALLSQTDVFTLPSVSDTSSLGLLEAMASGAAVVSTSVGGPAALVKDHLTGRIVDPRPGPLAGVLEEILRDATDRRALAGAGRAWVLEERTVAATARRYVSAYRRLLDARSVSNVHPG
ncbi:MAG: glycosyltransferase [Thermoplasmata archaeon]|nr:glycosyltransferase [Thermoplasmata archaeon]